MSIIIVLVSWCVVLFVYVGRIFFEMQVDRAGRVLLVAIFAMAFACWLRIGEEK
jgi:hypothetical protein